MNFNTLLAVSALMLMVGVSAAFHFSFTGAAVGTATISISSTGGFVHCERFNAMQTQCIGSGCAWEIDTLLCKSSVTSLNCSSLCSTCATVLQCTNSSRNCVWESTGFCHENFTAFTYATGGVANSTGFFNFTPLDCSQDPSKCDSRFDVEHGFYKVEQMCSDNIDNDADGAIDCSDVDCSLWPFCTSHYNASQDIDVPRVAHMKSSPNTNSADFVITTTEPTNASLVFYGQDSSCTFVVKTISEPNLPNCSLDDYFAWHRFSLVQSEIPFLSAGKTFYYRIQGRDQAGLRFETACLSFTTPSSQPTYNFRMITSSGNITISNQSGDFSYNFSQGGQSTNGFRDASVNIGDAVLRGAVLLGSESINFSNAVFSGTSVLGKAFKAINSTIWLETAQGLGLRASDNVSITIPTTGDVLYKCDDNGANCVQMTECYNVSASNSTHTVVDVAVAAGFSSYTLTESASQVSTSIGRRGEPSTAATVLDFAVEPAFIEEVLFPGQRKVVPLHIVNLGQAINVSVQSLGFVDLISPSERFFVLEVGGTKVINITLSALNNTQTGNYTGKLLISSGSINRTVEIVIKVNEQAAQNVPGKPIESRPLTVVPQLRLTELQPIEMAFFVAVSLVIALALFVIIFGIV